MILSNTLISSLFWCFRLCYQHCD